MRIEFCFDTSILARNPISPVEPVTFLSTRDFGVRFAEYHWYKAWWKDFGEALEKTSLSSYGMDAVRKFHPIEVSLNRWEGEAAEAWKALPNTEKIFPRIEVRLTACRRLGIVLDSCVRVDLMRWGH